MSRSFKQKVLKQLGAVLKQLRLERGLSVLEISLQADLSIQSIVSIETGEPVSYDKYKKLLGFYHKTFDIVVMDMV